MRTLAKLTTTELKLIARDPMALSIGLLFPPMILIILGNVPGFQDIDPRIGRSVLELYLPITICLALISTAISFVPAILTSYRERGVLRRLATTPIGPARLLAAQIAANLLLAVVAVGFVLVIGVLAFDIGVPGQSFGFALAFLCAALALFSCGLLIAALAPTAKSGSGIGMLVYFPSLLFAGVWIPRDLMPDILRTISDFTPSGAAVQSLQDTILGYWPTPLHLGVLLGYTLFAGFLAARYFRWE